MPIYNFTFSESAIGLPVTVKDDSDQSVVNTGTLSDAVYTLTLDEGSYTARAFDSVAGITYQADGILDIAGSIEAGGGGSPTADTAFLIATATIATDNTAHDIELTWDDRFPRVDWLTDNGDGTFTAPDGGLQCVMGSIGGGVFDFTDASAVPDAPSGEVGNGLHFNIDDSLVLSVDPDNAALSGQTVVTLNADTFTSTSAADIAPSAVLSATAKGYAAESDGSTLITDGSCEVTLAVTITRGGSAPTLP